MNPERILSSFFEMVRIESPSRRESSMAAYCMRRLEDLGFDVRVDESASRTGSDTGNVIAFLPGTDPAFGRIAFSAHMDTVTPCAGIEPRIVVEEVGGESCELIRSAGDTILSGDDKAGIAAILEAVACVLERGLPHPAITVVLTTCEEVGLLGASGLDSRVFASTSTADAAEAPASEYGAAASESVPAAEAANTSAASFGSDPRIPCFVLDADGAPGTVITGSPYHYLLNATFHGRAAHAGVAPETGVSAIQMACEAIANMPLGRIDECTTANIGTLQGGSAMNVVAAECKLVGECRSLHDDRVEAQRAAMTKAMQDAAESFGGTVDIEWTLDYPAIMLSEDDEIVGRLRAAIDAAGLQLRLATTGGGADANVLVMKGANAVTLGIGMANFHTCDEYIKVRDLQDSARLVEAIIAEYARA